MILASVFAAFMLIAASSACRTRESGSSHGVRHGKHCSSGACYGLRCSHIPGVFCVSYRGGCEALFLKTNQDPRGQFHDVTQLCFANINLKVAADFLEEVTNTNHRKLTVTYLNTRQDIVHKTFLSLNLLATEAAKAVGYYLAITVSTTPTEENRRQMRNSIELLRALLRNRGHLSVSIGKKRNNVNKADYLTIRKVWKYLMEDLKEALSIAERMYAILEGALPTEKLDHAIRNHLAISSYLVKNDKSFDDAMSHDGRGRCGVYGDTCPVFE